MGSKIRICGRIGIGGVEMNEVLWEALEMGEKRR